MCEEHDDFFLVGGTVREGYVKPLGGPWKKIQYAEVEGLAVFEGCIILGGAEEFRASSKKIEALASDNPDLLTKPKAEHRGSGIKGQQYRWPSRTIPYLIDPDVPNPQRVTEAMDHWHQRTSVRFRPHNGEKDFLRIQRNGSGCASKVGRQGGEQALVLRDTCSAGNLIHELGHCVGLWHEQSRSDRDQFLRIVWDNIVPGAEMNFSQHIADGVDLNEYDYASIMHYPAEGGNLALDQTRPVIEPLKPLPPGLEKLGQRVALSAGDIAAVEKMYAAEPMPA